MAFVKKCDRCGTIYEANRKDDECANGVALINLDMYSKTYMVKKIYDLCPECLKHIKDFLGMEDKTEDY